MKRCNHCKIDKNESEFNKNRSTKTGLQNCCRECHRPYVKKWDTKHKEERKVYLSLWHIQNIERRHKRNNLLFRLRYYTDKKFRDKKNEQKRNSIQRKRASDSAWLEKYRMWCRNNRRKRRVIQLKNGGSHSEADWLAMCELFGHRCVCCGRDKKLTRDHVIPLSKGGSDNIENIQPLCQNCNSKKHNKTIDYRF